MSTAIFLSLQQAKHLVLENEDRLNSAGFGSRDVLLSSTLKTLTPLEEKVIRMRYGLDDTECSFKEIGQSLGLSHQRVRMIEAMALRKMRNPHRSRALRQCLPSYDPRPIGKRVYDCSRRMAELATADDPRRLRLAVARATIAGRETVIEGLEKVAEMKHAAESEGG